MIYQWNGDLNVIIRQTKESKRVGEILEGLKLGGANSKGSSDTDNIPNTLNSDQVDIETVVGQGVFKTAYNFKLSSQLRVLRKSRLSFLKSTRCLLLSSVITVGCKNKALSENYAKQLYTREYLRGASVTGWCFKITSLNPCKAFN
jgi:hypothetical protein